jgi:hypothetical protein
MNTSTARKTIARAFNATAQDATLAKADRKVLNPALFALGLPTFGDERTFGAYVSLLTSAEKAVFVKATAPAKAAPAKTVRTAPVRKACGHKFCADNACKWTKAA